MMKVILTTWESFGQQVEELRAEWGESSSSPLLFRGQANALWPLATTLERRGQTRMSFRDFYRLITTVGPAVESFTGVNAPEYDHELPKTFATMESFFDPDRFPSGAVYPYMIYLRHHGFPSPLLDWSRSPYVAAFFAFSSDQPESPAARSIFVYSEAPGGVKGGAVGEPTIRALGPYVKAHRRHFRQQSTYTICHSYQSQWQFDSHQHVFDHARPGQDLLWRFDLPSAERVKILRSLNDFNLNAFSLFDSEEALLETMWLREYVLTAK
jgi:hypothetical protein